MERWNKRLCRGDRQGSGLERRVFMEISFCQLE